MGAEADAKRTGSKMDRYVLMLISTPLFLSLELAMSVKYKNKKSLLCTMNISKDCEFASFAKK